MACPSSMASERKPPDHMSHTTFGNISSAPASVCAKVPRPPQVVQGLFEKRFNAQGCRELMPNGGAVPIHDEVRLDELEGELDLATRSDTNGR